MSPPAAWQLTVSHVEGCVWPANTPVFRHSMRFARAVARFQGLRAAHSDGILLLRDAFECSAARCQWRGGLRASAHDLLRFFPQLVRALGGDPEAMSCRLGLYPGELSRQAPEHNCRSWVKLLEHPASELCCRDFGMWLARLQTGGRALGPISAVMRSSNTRASLPPGCRAAHGAAALGAHRRDVWLCRRHVHVLRDLWHLQDRGGPYGARHGHRAQAAPRGFAVAMAGPHVHRAGRARVVHHCPCRWSPCWMPLDHARAIVHGLDRCRHGVS